MYNSRIEVVEVKTYEECDEILSFFKEYPFINWLEDNLKRKEYIEKIIANGHFLTSYFKGVPGGFAVFYCNDKERNIAFVSTFAINDSIGMAKGLVYVSLVRQIINMVSNEEIGIIRLEVDKANERARTLYEKSGFKYTSEETDHSLFMEISFADALKRIEKLT